MYITAHILITAIVAIVSTVGVYNYLPLSVIEKFGPKSEKKLGVTITTINATDTIKNSRGTINTNFTNLNTDKIEVATTSVGNITALSNLATVGTLTSGSLGSGFTAVVVARGGTGSTTLSSNQVLLGNGTNAIGVVSGLGTSGQFLTSQGVSTAPIWTTSAVDEAAAYTWTGNHTWNGGGTATSTFNRGVDIDADSDTPFILNGLENIFPATRGSASSTVLSRNASSQLSWNAIEDLVTLATALVSSSTSATYTAVDTTIISATLTGGSLGTDNVVRGELVISDLDIASGATTEYRIDYGGTDVCSIAFTNSSGGTVSNWRGSVGFMLHGAGATNAQRAFCSGIVVSGTNANDIGATVTAIEVASNQSNGSSAIDSTVNQTIQLEVETAGAGNSTTIAGATLILE